MSLDKIDEMSLNSRRSRHAYSAPQLKFSAEMFEDGRKNFSV
jgi:hypothetical protein